MKQIFLIAAVFLMVIPQTKGQTFASANLLHQKDGLMPYTPYNFRHLSEFDLRQESELPANAYRENSGHVHAGPIMTGVGLLGMIVGGIGMVEAKGGGDQSNAFVPGDLNQANWKMYNSFTNVALASAALFTIGLIVSAIQGDIHSVSGHSSYSYDRGGWWFSRHHHHNWQGGRGRHGGGWNWGGGHHSGGHRSGGHHSGGSYFKAHK